jgi:hypothetical protein
MPDFYPVFVLVWLAMKEKNLRFSKTNLLTNFRWLQIAFVSLTLLLGTNALAKIGTKSRPITDMIVLHSFGGSSCKGERWTHSRSPRKLKSASDYLAKKDLIAGAHLIIDRSGNLAVSTPLDNIANHVFGRANKKDKHSYNERAIGIELLNHGDGKQDFPKKQLDRLVAELKKLVSTYKIRRSGIVTHAALDQRKVFCGNKQYFRRTDPGKNFPMKQVLDRVFEK